MNNLKVRLRSIVEALLFISDQPMTAEKLADVVEVGVEEIKQTVEELSTEYKRSDRGFQIREVAGGYRMYSHPAYAPYIEKLILSYDHRRLSQAALETLSIIAYKQPVTKADVAAIRGVNSEGVVNTLVNRGLVKEIGKQDAPGLPLLYGTTSRFLESFGLRSASELPSLDEFVPDEAAQKQIIDTLRTQVVME